MKKAILILSALALLSCNKEENDGCKCYGKFTNDGTTFFYGQNVDCDTGAPVSETNPNSFFLGCD